MDYPLGQTAAEEEEEDDYENEISSSTTSTTPAVPVLLVSPEIEEEIRGNFLLGGTMSTVFLILAVGSLAGTFFFCLVMGCLCQALLRGPFSVRAPRSNSMRKEEVELAEVQERDQEQASKRQSRTLRRQRVITAADIKICKTPKDAVNEALHEQKSAAGQEEKRGEKEKNQASAPPAEKESSE